jgi:hypothetical protein
MVLIKGSQGRSPDIWARFCMDRKHKPSTDTGTKASMAELAWPVQRVVKGHVGQSGSLSFILGWMRGACCTQWRMSQWEHTCWALFLRSIYFLYWKHVNRPAISSALRLGLADLQESKYGWHPHVIQSHGRYGFEYDLSCGLLINAFIMLRFIFSIPNFLRDYIMKRCWILSNVFSESFEIITWYLSFM